MRHAWIVALVLGSPLAESAGAVGVAVDVSVYDRARQRVLPVYRHEGRHYVVGRPGNEFQVRVRNRAGSDMLAVVSVDGVNAVTGETASWSQAGYVLRPHQGYEIKGWRKSLERTAAFFFTEHPNSYATRTGRPDNVGVIGVALFRRRAEPAILLPRPWHGEPRAPAADESALNESKSPQPAQNAADAARGGRDERVAGSRHERRRLGTGHGRSEISRVTYADFERASATPEEVVVIHYDTYGNLVAAGVISASPAGAPDPVPFPGQFVPDPR
jgi:hypothetical protein